MRRILKWVGILAAVLVVAVVSLPFLINVNQFKPMLESELSTALNREVKLGNLKLSLLSGEVTADDLSVAEDQAFGKPAFIQREIAGRGRGNLAVSDVAQADRDVPDHRPAGDRAGAGALGRLEFFEPGRQDQEVPRRQRPPRRGQRRWTFR